MNKICAIISGGDFSPLDNINKADYIIACDKGFEYAQKCGIVPNLLVGDFDSYRGAIPNNINVLSLPIEKDDTDTMAAIRYAISKEYSEIVLYCAMGGRLDHLIANIQAATFAKNNGVSIKVVDNTNELYFISNESITIKKKQGYSLSLFSLTNDSIDVNINGAKYPLKNAHLTNDFPIGVSNEWKEDVVFSVGDGIIMIVLSKMD